jgi:hypothetical protein
MTIVPEHDTLLSEQGNQRQDSRSLPLAVRRQMWERIWIKLLAPPATTANEADTASGLNDQQESPDAA